MPRSRFDEMALSICEGKMELSHYGISLHLIGLVLTLMSFLLV